MTKQNNPVILFLIVDSESDPRLLGKSISLAGVFYFGERGRKMIVKDSKGNELLEIIKENEIQAERLYKPLNYALVVVKIGSEYLMGWNYITGRYVGSN